MQAAKVIVLPIRLHSVFSCSVTAVQQLIFKSEKNSPTASSEFFRPRAAGTIRPFYSAYFDVNTNIILGISEMLPQYKSQAVSRLILPSAVSLINIIMPQQRLTPR